MQDMKRPPGLLRETTRHGKVKWYVRPHRGARIRIHGEYGTPEFMAQYHAAMGGQPAPKVSTKRPTESLAWLIDRYRDSAAWRSLSDATRRQRDNIFQNMIRKAGDLPYAEITRKDIAHSRDQRAEKPAAARHFMQSVRGLFRWALEAGFVEVDPTEGVKTLHVHTSGFAAWTDDDVAAYERRWPVGTPERVWFAVLRHTGLRRGDAVRFGRQHIRDGIASLKTEKSGHRIEVTFPILPELALVLEAGPTGDLTFICGASGGALTKESFGNKFREACRSAGIDKSAHGLRKYAAADAANKGATERELDAMFGWTDGKQAAYYTRTANRRALSLGFFARAVRNVK